MPAAVQNKMKMKKISVVTPLPKSINIEAVRKEEHGLVWMEVEHLGKKKSRTIVKFFHRKYYP